MESGDIIQTSEWIASQKDRDRERRRVRDRQRRQSMSKEERERHLARRRRNYQLRRQRASMMNSSCSGFEMDMISNENLEPVPVTEVGFQFDVSNGYGAMSASHDASETKSEGESKKNVRLVHIKRLARAIHSTSGSVSDDSSRVEEAELDA